MKFISTLLVAASLSALSTAAFAQPSDGVSAQIDRQIVLGNVKASNDNLQQGVVEGVADGGGANPGTVYAKSQPWLDLSASYKYNDSLTFTFDATNLLDSYFQDSFGKGSLGAVYPRDTRRFDQTIELGLRYKL